MSCPRHGYPWPSLTTSPYRSSHLVGFQGYITYPHIAAECIFELIVLLLPGHIWGSIGVHHLWACENKNSHWKITMTHTQTTYINRIALHTGKKGARSAEVGALASVFEKSATELKQQKLLNRKQTIQIATFNVKTLNRIGQLPELTASAVEHKIDKICIQEHRW